MEEKIKEFDKNILLALLIGFLSGLALGVLVSPIKAGINMRNTISIGSNNGCSNNRIYKLRQSE